MGGALSLNSDAKPSPSEKKKDPDLPYHMFDEIVELSTADPKPTQKDARSTSGIFLDKKKMKYWVDEQNKNCFTIYPRGLSITWGEDEQYWSYHDPDEGSGSDPNLEVAKLLNVCWLEIHGKLELSYLNPDVTYEVFFEIKLLEDASGWGIPVDLRLKLPQGRVQERKENLGKKPKNRWLLLKVGDIYQPKSGQNGDVVISLFQYGTHWKKGLVIKGIVISPSEE